ncbi:MAG: toxic anion resistance protein [Oscillospiraceae bacterium]|nr:toxic anion resistance protein [Oscillospiraceae bacterium]
MTNLNQENNALELEMPVPELTLTLEEEPKEEVKPVDPLADVEPELIQLSNLSEEEQKTVLEFSEKIDITDSNIILQYGAAAQKRVAGFSETALNSVRTKDLGEVGDMISDLVVELKGFTVDEKPKGLLGLFKKTRNKIESLKSNYDKAEVNVEKISGMLEGHQVTLLKDIAMLDKMYEMNLAYFKELTMYIIAGKEKLKKERETTLVELREKAQKSGLAEDAQAANDFANLCDRFEKKLHDLELTRTVSIQMSPQIRLIQNNDTLMAEKIQSTIVNTIPLWKSQMVLALGLAHSQQAMEAQREVTNMTNELLKKNAEMLKTSTIETAKEAERGIVDIDTLKNTNQMLIDTLDEVSKIQQEGRAKRAAAEIELGKIEGQLKQKLLSMSN